MIKSSLVPIPNMALPRSEGGPLRAGGQGTVPSILRRPRVASVRRGQLSAELGDPPEDPVP
jgi:hypothetical protein